MLNDDTLHDLGRNVDSDELSYFLVEMPQEHTETEKSLKLELASLRKMKRALSDLVLIRKEEKSRVIVKTGEKAKEEAMELLRSGAIQIEDKNERHTFKRKPKDCDDEESVVRNPPKPAVKPKAALYPNFVRGPKLLAPQAKQKLRSESEPSEIRPFTSYPSSDTHIIDFDSVLDKHISATEAAASKRKQQLIALSEEEDNAVSEPSGYRGVRNDYDNLHANSVQSDDKVDHHAHGPFSSGTTLYVGYHKITTPFIYETFAPIGEILRVRIGEHQNHAYVTMATYEMAQKALELDHRMFNNRLLRVSHARKSSAMRCRRGNRPFRPFSPKARPDQEDSYHTVPPSDSRTDSRDVPRTLVTYEDLNCDEN